MDHSTANLSLSDKPLIVVVGAGVIGLTCAKLLTDSGYRIKVVSAHFPSENPPAEYTSHWAGAHFRPFPSKNAHESIEASYARETYKHFRKLERDFPESSVRFVTGMDMIENASDLYKNIGKGYSEGLDDFEVLDPNEFREPIDFAAQYKTWVVNPPLYLAFLVRNLTLQGAEFIPTRLKSLKQAFSAFPDAIGVINCTGDGLQYDGGLDPDCYPIRGQTLLIRPPKVHSYQGKTITYQAADGNWTFMIERPMDGGVIVGGTKQPNDLLGWPREADTAQVLQRASKIFPELMSNEGKWDILKTNVGFRPARNGGSRVELERVEGAKRFIVHAYGLGGSGYEMSHGVGLSVLELVTNHKNNSISKL